MPDAFEISGVEEMQREIAALVEALANFAPIAAGQVGQAMDKALMVLQGDAADYPPAPPDSNYRRTGTLGRLWVSGRRVVEEMKGGAFVLGRVGNATPYGPWVQDPDAQAEQHRGRWRTTAQIVKDNEAVLNEILAEAGAGIVEGIAREAVG